MPRWESPVRPDGRLRRELIGDRVGVFVETHPSLHRTLVTVSLVLPGADEASADAGQLLGERLMAAALEEAGS